MPIDYPSNTIIINTGGQGDITGVNAGTNLTGGGSSGEVTVSLTSSITSGLDKITGLGLLSSSVISGAFVGNGFSLTNIPNGALQNSSVTINGSSVQLGGALTVNTTGAAYGDLTGYYPSPVVVSIQTYPVSGALPQDGQALVWNQANFKWVPTTTGSNGGGDITGVTAGTNLTGGGSSGDVTVSLTSSIVSGLNKIAGLSELTSSGISGSEILTTTLSASSTIQAGGNITTAGDLYVQGGDIRTAASTFELLSIGAPTTIRLGGPLSTTHLQGAMAVSGNVTLGNAGADVITIQTMPLQLSGAAVGQAIAWNGTNYVPTTTGSGGGGGDITGVTAGTNLSGGGTSGDVTLSLASTISSGLTSITGLTNLSSSAITGSFSGSGAGLTGIPNAGLTNSSISVNGTSVSLGGSVTTTAAGTNISSSTAGGTVTLNLTSSITSGLTNISGLTSLSSSRGFFDQLSVTGSTTLGNGIFDPVSIQTKEFSIGAPADGQAIAWSNLLSQYVPTTTGSGISQVEELRAPWATATSLRVYTSSVNSYVEASDNTLNLNSNFNTYLRAGGPTGTTGSANLYARSYGSSSYLEIHSRVIASTSNDPAVVFIKSTSKSANGAAEAPTRASSSVYIQAQNETGGSSINLESTTDTSHFPTINFTASCLTGVDRGALNFKALDFNNQAKRNFLSVSGSLNAAASTNINTNGGNIIVLYNLAGTTEFTISSGVKNGQIVHILNQDIAYNAIIAGGNIGAPTLIRPQRFVSLICISNTWYSNNPVDP